MSSSAPGVGRPRKKKNRLSDSGLNNVDSTAPVKKIVDELQHKNPQAYKYYCRVLGKRPPGASGYHKLLVGHNLSKFPDDWDGTLSDAYFEKFPFKSSNPHIITPLKYVNKKDPLAEYMSMKKDWFRKYNKMAIRSSVVENEYKPLNDGVIHCPKVFIDMAAHLQRDPDPYFDSFYNWYYTGRGNLHQITLFDSVYLVHSELTCLYLTPSNNEMQPDFEKSFIFSCGKDNYILETATSPQQLLIALRTLKKIFLLKVTQNEENLVFEQVKTFEALKIPYTSVEFDPLHQHILYITSLDNKVHIVNLDTLQFKKVVLSKDEDLLNNWTTVQGFDRLHYVHATRLGVHVYDKRTHEKAYSISNYKDICENCNEITLVRKCEKYPCFYVGTNHILFYIDIRSRDSTKPQILNRWTHGMQCPPTTMSIVDYELGKELICLSSQWPEDTVIIVNDTARSGANLQPDSMIMPFRLPSIMTTINDARTEKYCLDPTLNIDKRISCALTGCLLLERDENYDIYTQNSLGDITKQSLYPEHLQHFMKKDFEKTESWASGLKSNLDKFEVMEILEISPFWKDCMKVPTDLKFYEKPTANAAHVSENEVIELYNCEKFDDLLLTAWNMDEAKEDSFVNV